MVTPQHPLSLLNPGYVSGKFRPWNSSHRRAASSSCPRIAWELKSAVAWTEQWPRDSRNLHSPKVLAQDLSGQVLRHPQSPRGSRSPAAGLDPLPPARSPVFSDMAATDTDLGFSASSQPRLERINPPHPGETESLVNVELPVAAPVRGSTRRGRSCHIRRPARRS
jgi:hypothetical protein